jgi:HAD superfamily hydrolase (TIGR01509 family)
MTALPPFAGVIFDMDGTLLDTELVFKEVVFDVSRTLGFTMSEGVHLGMVGVSHEAANALLVETYGASFPYEIFAEECRRMMRGRMDGTIPVKPGVTELLAELTERGTPMAVATSSRAIHALSHLGSAGLLDIFQAVVTRDDVANPKPHPEPYLTAARRLGLNPATCLAIEDSHTGVRSAHGAGMTTIMVPDLMQPSEEIRRLCRVMGSLHEVRAALAQTSLQGI